MSKSIDALLEDAQQTGVLALVDKGIKALPELEEYDLYELTELGMCVP